MMHDDYCPVTQRGEYAAYCDCASLQAARTETAQRIQASISEYADTLTGKREQTVAITCAALAVVR